MEHVASRIRGIRKQVVQLIEQLNLSQKKLNQLHESHEQLAVENSSLKSRIVQLEEELKTLKLAQALKGSGDQGTQELKLQINTYIRDIDRCLAMLNRDNK